METLLPTDPLVPRLASDVVVTDVLIPIPTEDVLVNIRPTFVEFFLRYRLIQNAAAHKKVCHS